VFLFSMADGSQPPPASSPQSDSGGDFAEIALAFGAAAAIVAWLL